MARTTTNQTAWTLVAVLAFLLLGAAGSGVLIAGAQGWELTSAWGFGREQRFAIGDKAPGMTETIKLGFFGLRRSTMFPRRSQDVEPHLQGAVSGARSVTRQLDTEALYQALKKATRQAFEVVQSSHADEHFYAFALYTEGLGAYLSPTCNTEEALLRRAAGSGFEPIELRWSPCDWEYHLRGNDYFKEVQQLLNEADPYQQLADDTDADRNTQAQQVFETSLRVLKDLDAEGLFGRGADRERVVLNLLKGDQDEEERLAWAQQLNPPPVWKRYQAEVEAGYAVWERKQDTGR